MNIGKIIRAERRKQKITFKELGKTIGVSCAYLCDIEKGNRKVISGIVLAKIVKYLGIEKKFERFVRQRLFKIALAHGYLVRSLELIKK